MRECFVGVSTVVGRHGHTFKLFRFLTTTRQATHAFTRQSVPRLAFEYSCGVDRHDERERERGCLPWLALRRLARPYMNSYMNSYVT